MEKPNHFAVRLDNLIRQYRTLINRVNEKVQHSNGIFERYRYPVLTRSHVPLTWRYDFDHESNPYLMERNGINSVFNAGAIEINGIIHLIARVEGTDRKSFFAVAESVSGVDRFRFRDYPIYMPETEEPDINVYDMRVVKHEDGYIYGLFCSERKDPLAPISDTSSAVARCAIARTTDLTNWERLDDLRTPYQQERNVVLHPEFIEGKYAFYTRPYSRSRDGFVQDDMVGGIGWGLSDSIEHARILQETIIDPKEYHTIKEVKNGQGPAPIKTSEGWLHIAHGVRRTASGVKYVLYLLLTDLMRPEVVLRRPGGYLIAPEGDERSGDVPNVVFCNGMVARDNGDVLIYYASSDTRMHVAVTTVDKLLDYALHTPEDMLRSRACVELRCRMIEKNLTLEAGRMASL